MNEYEQQAVDFLNSTGTKLKVSFLRKDRYFESDTEARNIYRFTLTNKNGEYSAEFGDSLQRTKKALDEGTRRQNPVTSYDILACLGTNVPELFSEFCSEFGYEELPLSKYPEVIRIYKSYKREARGLKRLFNSQELEQLSEIV